MTRPLASSHTAKPITRSTPTTSTTLLSGPNSASSRVATICAEKAPWFSRRYRAVSSVWRS